MKRLIVLAAAVLVAAIPREAQAEGSKYKLYGMLAYVAPLSESDQNIGGVTDAVKASSEFGFSFGGEFRASPLIGIELDYTYANQSIEHGQAGLLGETTFQPISATFNLHAPVGNLDVYGGPTAAYVNWGDLKAPSGGTDIKVDPEFAFGLSGGVDLNITQQFVATGGLRWLNLQAQAEGGNAVDVNPLFARVGVAVRF